MACGDAGNRMRQVSPYYYNIIEKASAYSSKLWYTAYTKPKCFKGNQNTECQVCYNSSTLNATLTFKTQFACCWDITHGYCYFPIFLNSSKKKSLCRASCSSLFLRTFSGLTFPSNRLSLIGYPVLPGVPWKHENVTICLSCALGRELPTLPCPAFKLLWDIFYLKGRSHLQGFDLSTASGGWAGVICPHICLVIKYWQLQWDMKACSCFLKAPHCIWSPSQTASSGNEISSLWRRQKLNYPCAAYNFFCIS